MLPKHLLKEYLTFTKKDRIGALVFIAVVGGSLLAPRLFSKKPEPLALKQDSVLVLAIDTLQKNQTKRKNFDRPKQEDYSYPYERSESKSFTAGALFQFDPNTASFNDWQRMGLNEKTSKTILRYVSKGGKFYKPEDLQKIWGMPEGFYDRIKDYIVITSVQRNYPSYTDSKPAFVREERKPITVNVNEADTTAFIALPGIGSKLSARIIAFREKLGGFYSVEQVGETYGLPDSTFQKIRGKLQIDGSNIRKINVNTATKDELKVHPYIRWNLANAIVEYRNQHGAFKSLEDLKNIVLIDEATYNKIVHYLNH
ncbi:MAG TPA: helix-hairpin-helix domain-containing protein [Flavisolibacter sp.]|nr:helix-hairpin-helix domain-containing protein [Flavisolibacter sp.]